MLCRLPRPGLLKSCFARQLVVCALAFFLASQAANAGFSLQIENSSASSEEQSPSPDPKSPAVKHLVLPERDAHTGGASGQSSAASPAFGGQTALPGSACSLTRPEPSSWLLATMQLKFPPPIPSGVFHPPRLTD
jgi:hypothetical protein